MKKLALIGVIAILSMVMLAVTASAGGNGWKNFHGTYEMSASGSCIHSENGYTQNAGGWYLPNAGVVYAGTTVSNGTWVFNRNKTGTYSYVMYATVTPPVQDPPCLIPGGIRIFNSIHEDKDKNEVNEYTFTYNITNFGDITITTEEGDTLEGSISNDKKTIILFDALREKGPGAAVCPWWTIICTATRTLIKVHD